MLATGLIVIGILSRFIFHMPNFTPVIAIALFAGVYLPKRQAIIVPIALYVISDFFVGFHEVLFFTWGSMALIALIGINSKNKKSIKNMASASLLSALLFYVTTNFGVWVMMSTYPKTVAGLFECYIAAIPFFRNTLVSTLLYSAVLFGCYEFIATRVKNTRFATVL
jgi:hypothetical protein